jgi:hypothetical protein
MGTDFKPDLNINEGAKLSQPSKDAGLDIKHYRPVPADAIKLEPPVDPTKVSPCVANPRFCA